MDLNLFLLFVLAHLLGDFPFQTNWVWRKKLNSLLGGLWHAGILALGYLIILAPYWANPEVLATIAGIAIIHYLQDRLKVKLVDQHKKLRPLLGFYFDQVAHLLLIAGAAFWLSSQQLASALPNWGLGERTLKYVAVYLIVMLLSTFVWNVINHIRQAGTQPKRDLQQDWQGSLARGAIVTMVFGVAYLLANT